ncbi:MAG: hypothetical protein GC155_09265 [Alphaproteobacteria bacterium]|nr:hypothetical protein [Alphaproteobacteria bacterium]
MKRAFAGVILPLAAIALSACADESYGYSNYGYGYADRGGWYDGYYDNYYGPLYGGYWAPGDVFYYQTYRGGPYVVDRDHHFRRQQFDRSHRFRTRDHRDDHDRGRDHDHDHDHHRH